MSETLTLEQVQAEKQRRAALAAIQAEKQRRVSPQPSPSAQSAPSDILAGIGLDPGDTPRTDFSQPKPPGLRQSASDFLGEAAQSQFTPQGGGLADLVGRTAAGFGKAAVDDPFQTLIVDPASAPGRAAAGLVGASGALSQGKFGEAGRQASEGATAGIESILLFAPGVGTLAGRAAVSPARRQGLRALKDADPQLRSAAERAQRLRGSGAPATTADFLSRQGQSVVKGAARRPGPAQDIAQDALDFRQAGQFSRVRQDIREGFGVKGDFDEVIDDLAATRKREAAPLFEKAFRQPTRVTPELKELLERPALKRALTQADILARNETGKGVDLSALTTTKRSAQSALRSTADDILDNVESLKASLPSAPTERQASGRSLASFIVQRGGVKDIGGDVRSILGGSRVRPGLLNARGRQIDDLIVEAQEAGFFPGRNLDQGDIPTQREFLDALADDLRGKKLRQDDLIADTELKSLNRQIQEFDRLGIDISAPRETLIKQIETATGQKISEVGVRPGKRRGEINEINTRTLSFTRQALDEQIQAAAKNQNKTEFAILTKLRTKFNDEIRANNPAFLEADKAFSGKSALIDAMEAGRRAAARVDDSSIRRAVKRIAPADLPAFRAGFADGLEKAIGQSGSDFADVTLKILSHERQAGIRAVLGDEAGDALLNRVRVENLMKRVRDRISPNVGSDTAENLQQTATQILGAVLNAGRRPVSSAAVALTRVVGVKGLSRAIIRRQQKIDEEILRLATDDPQKLLALIDQSARRISLTESAKEAAVGAIRPGAVLSVEDARRNQDRLNRRANERVAVEAR